MESKHLEVTLNRIGVVGFSRELLAVMLQRPMAMRGEETLMLKADALKACVGDVQTMRDAFFDLNEPRKIQVADATRIFAIFSSVLWKEDGAFCHFKFTNAFLDLIKAQR